MLDRWAHAQWSPWTQGVSMASLRMAFDDWLTHLSHNPAEQLKLWQRALQNSQQWLAYVAQAQQAQAPTSDTP